MMLTPTSRFALGLAALVGLVCAAIGLWRPGQTEAVGLAGGSAKPMLAVAQKKFEAIKRGQEEVARDGDAFLGLQGTEGEHRVFVSAQLVYLPESAEPVVPLDRRTKTEDGIEVGWKIKHGFDPASPRIQEEDPDADGFTNREEFLAGTHPLRNEDSPAKESKLKSRSGDPVPMSVSFAEKSGGSFTLRFQVGSRRAEFRGKPGDSFWVMAGPNSLEVFTDEAKMISARSRAEAASRSPHVLPLRLVSYEEKVEVIRDASAGGVEVEVDNSFVMLARGDGLKESAKLLLSSPLKPRGISWDVGDIRLHAPGSKEGELGPFRVGETFSFGGKSFAVIGRSGKKVQLQYLDEPGKDPIWIPPETSGSPGP